MLFSIGWPGFRCSSSLRDEYLDPDSLHVGAIYEGNRWFSNSRREPVVPELVTGPNGQATEPNGQVMKPSGALVSELTEKVEPPVGP